MSAFLLHSAACQEISGHSSLLSAIDYAHAKCCVAQVWKQLAMQVAYTRPNWWDPVHYSSMNLAEPAEPDQHVFEQKHTNAGSVHKRGATVAAAHFTWPSQVNWTPVLQVKAKGDAMHVIDCFELMDT